MADDKKEKKPSIWDKWTNWVNSRGKTRPSTTASWGKGMDKITISLPKSIYAQMKLVSLRNLMEQYPNDFSVKESFLKEILPLTTFCGKQVESPDELGYARTEVLITMYCDLLLAPLSQGVQEMTIQTIQEVLPQIAD